MHPFHELQEIIRAHTVEIDCAKNPELIPYSGIGRLAVFTHRAIKGKMKELSEAKPAAQTRPGEDMVVVSLGHPDDPPPYDFLGSVSEGIDRLAESGEEQAEEIRSIIRHAREAERRHDEVQLVDYRASLNPEQLEEFDAELLRLQSTWTFKLTDWVAVFDHDPELFKSWLKSTFSA